MNKFVSLSLSVIFLLLAIVPATAQMRNPANLGREIDTINDSVTVINEVMRIPAKSIPAAMFAKAEGLVIVPSMVKGGFGIGGAHGRGIFMTRRPDRSWEAPVFITMTNGSFGFQIGLQAIDVVLIFNSRRSVESFQSGKFTLGVDAAATAGPIGRQAQIGTDITLKSEIFSYSRTRGLFVGAAIDGGVMSLDNNSTNLYYNQAGGFPPGASALIQTVSRFSGAPLPAQPGQQDGLSNQPGTQPQEGVPYSGQLGIGPANSYQNQNQNPNQSPSQSQNYYADYSAPGTGNANPGGGPAARPNPGQTGGASSAASISTRRQLADAFTKLGPMLDPQWQTYLALPSEIFAGAETPDPPREVIQDTLNHYRAVAENNQYQALTSRQEFQTVFQLLGQYQQVLMAR